MDITNISKETVESIKEMRQNQISYEDILQKIKISKDELKKICRSFKLNKYCNIKKFDSNEINDYYLSVKSLRKTAKFFNTTRDTIRKYIKKELIIDKKEKTKTASQSVIDWRRRTKIKLVEYKGGKCECCDYNRSISVLQFHHKDPNEKDFTISGKSYGFEKLKIEVDKCILVCSNCHIEIHEEIRNVGYSEKMKNIKF